MLRRFSLYGFLKNQQYYDPFLILAFRQMGLSFLRIGILVAFREIMVNLMEVPSGAVADLFGRRKSMILSFVAYIVSFAIMGGAGLAKMGGHIGAAVLLPLLFGGMAFFAVGDAFRTGTHKAMIFAWLRLQGRQSERTKIYGYTRSWSKIGSSVSVVLAAAFVFATSNYVYVFFLSIVPYILNIVNFLGYPKELDGDVKRSISVKEVISHLKETLALSVKQEPLRRLILESMGFQGFFKAAKDYLQPILALAAVPLTTALFLSDKLDRPQQAALLVGPVYFVLYLCSALASRKAHVLVDRHGHEDRTARFLWGVTFVIMLGMTAAMYFRVYGAIIVGFMALYVMQNLWRPVLISRFDAHAEEARGATVLSIESQAKSVATMLIAPALGYAVDYVSLRADPSGGEAWLWPVGVLGVVLTLGFFLTGSRQLTGTQS